MNVPEITIIRKNIKHLYLRVYQDGRTVVSAPCGMTKHTIEQFIAKKSQWIICARHQQQQKSNHSLVTLTKNFTVLTLWGHVYPIEQREVTKNSLVIKEGICQINVRKDSTTTQLEKLIIDYYRVQLMGYLPSLVRQYEPLIGVSVKEIRTKNMKTKWGTCNVQDKRLWFNVHLARFDPKSIEYVVVHEMVHLLERHHNTRFYHLIERVMPDWQQWHDYLQVV
ncbi:MAG: M48 family metallopeptidase [Ostreibacterium sp.]